MGLIYLLEDEESIREFVLYALRNSGMEAEGFALPSQFWGAMAQQQPSLILLDIMLPEEDGLAVLKKIRAKQESKSLPVILLTAKGTEYDKIIGLDSGADDYVVKPFSVMELISRMKALLRRTGKEEHKEYRIQDLYVCPSKHLVTVKGEMVSLTLKEFDLLCILLENMTSVLTRDKIFSEIWGYGFDGENRTLDVHVRTLRQKLGDCGKLIETVRGVGYKLSEA
ncbi:response regulator transcription factor [Scatolibacter rhodanostii]|uniref:response regulator transcription factor n=1 Tax=Scatolibacter rhodanostii TaxID=2014781 RepID=UPI001FA8EB04|nr:response regulator transcription factor [Scatolibacter rhodanostii]